MDEYIRLSRFWMDEGRRYAERTLPWNHPYRIWFAQKILELKPQRILEVGANQGQNLLAIHHLNSQVEVYGCDIGIGVPIGVKVLRASAMDLPYRSRSFDLVFTHGLLMHISPDSVERVVGELIHCSSKYIAICEDLTLKGDGSYYGERNAIFIHDYFKLFSSLKPMIIQFFIFRDVLRIYGVFMRF